MTASAEAAASLDVDVLIVPAFIDDRFEDEPALAAAAGDEVARARAAGLFTGAPWQVLSVTPRAGVAARRVVLVGAGARDGWSAERARRVAATGALAARGARFTSAALVDRAAADSADIREVQAFVEGVVFANFDAGAHKTADPLPTWLDRVVVRTRTGGAAVAQAIERGRVLGECTNLARELANEPGNLLTPSLLAARAEAVAAETGLAIEVLDERAIADLGMGLLQGVARGSRQPPRVIVLRHEPAGAPAAPVLGLVGKGVTFDTGGISLKPPAKMDRMKDDMSGGAAVIAAMRAIALLRAPIRVVGVVPATENMPGGDATRPGDVLRSAAGTTVEVLDTDAEGRLILADGVWYARRCGATHLVDVATLTGSCVIALGHTTTGLFGVPDGWVASVRQAADRAGDRSWPMPTFEDYRALLKSDVADMANVTALRAAGAITGAWFVGSFAGGLPWVHLDIAGTAWAEEAQPYQPKGATGTAVRTLAELALGADDWTGA